MKDRKCGWIPTTILAMLFVLLSGANILAAETLEFRVIHKVTREPIPDVQLKIGINDEGRQAQTDPKGRCDIALGETTPDRLVINVWKPGFVPMIVDWNPSRDNVTIPYRYTLVLEPGTRIGGIIQNEQGKPISGVTVYLLTLNDESSIESVDIWDHPVKTDDHGHWQCNIIPTDLEVAIRLSHPDYADDGQYGSTPWPHMERLRDMTSVMTMQKGLMVCGRVLDQKGLPIEGASVAQGSSRHGTDYPETTTDQEGRFVFKHAKLGQMVLTVQAQGYAPELKEFIVDKETQPIEFHLGPGQTLKGQIVDTAGNPIAGAFLAADTWRGHRSLWWRADTDAQGRFQWNDAPLDEVLIDIGKQHYMSVRNVAMSPSIEEHVITLPPELKIQGKVVDVESGQPIDRFKLLTGSRWQPQPKTISIDNDTVLSLDWEKQPDIHWQRQQARTFSHGNYTATFTEPYDEHYICIEAVGYESEVSRAFVSDEGTVSYDFELYPGESPTGTVRLPDGHAADGAEVILYFPDTQIPIICNGRNINKEDTLSIKTKVDGHFAFAAPRDPYAIVILLD